MNYKFEQFKIEIKNPTVSVIGVNDNYNGTADIEVLMYVGNINNKTAQFGIQLNGFTYTDNWTQLEVEEWVTTELIKHEV